MAAPIGERRSCPARKLNKLGSMTWGEDDARKSHAFDDWKAVDADIRAFLQLSETWSTRSYADALSDAEREVSQRFDPDNDDPEEYFYDFMSRVGYLSESDYQWMLRAAVLRDAVTAFEVYVEKSAKEVIGRIRAKNADGAVLRLTLLTPKRFASPSWPTLCRIHEALGNNVDVEGVKYVRDLRHLLAHQRGELRTKKLREKFVAETGPRRGGPFDSRDVPLTSIRVVQMMDDLAAVARASDATIWRHTWGGEVPTELIALADQEGGPVLWSDKPD